MGGKPKRPGRPWGPARGACVEINQLVELMRGWLDGATVSVTQLHRLLTPDHFSDGRVPELRQLRSWLSGEGLRWDLVEAVADLCHPQESNQASERRLDAARQLWEKSQSSPTVPSGSELLSVTRELLEAKDHTIEVYQELQRARQAYEASEQGRHQALQVATVMFALLGQAQAKIVELTRRIDALEPVTAPAQRDVLETRLDRAQRQEFELREQLARAERERDIAQQVADHAARRVRALERELAAAADSDSGDERGGQLVGPEFPHWDSSAEDTALDDVDRTLEQARSVLDQEHQAVQRAADDIGYLPPSAEQVDADGRPVTVVRGETVSPSPAGSSDQADSGLFATTPDNFSTSPVPARMASDMLRFAGAATRRIARGLDLDEIILGLCRATVPTFADVTTVYLRDPLPVGDERPSGPLVLRLRRTDRRVDDPSADDGTDRLPARGEPHLSAAATEVCEVRPGSPLSEVLRGVRPVFTDSPPVQQALAQLLSLQGWMPQGTRQAIVAPLRGRRRVIGVVLFLRGSDRPAFQSDDLLVAAQLATHSALGVDKAVLYGREAYIADALQQSMLPAGLPTMPGVRLATRYLPAAETARVGGDWYDAFPLSGGRIGLVVGDVMGHSMTSAAVMGQLRSTLKTLARLNMPAAEVLARLDEQAQELGTDRLATCLYAVYDPGAQRVVLTNAGHPPPVLLPADGTASLLPVPPGVPIGVGGFGFEAIEVATPPGSTLLLYTDGLVESRLRDVEVGMEQLRSRCSTASRLNGPPQLEELCDGILNMLGPGDRDDDIALLAARLDGVTSADQPSPHDPA